MKLLTSLHKTRVRDREKDRDAASGYSRAVPRKPTALAYKDERVAPSIVNLARESLSWPKRKSSSSLVPPATKVVLS